MSEDEKMVVSDDDSSDSSSSYDAERELEERAATLERQVSDNKYLYDVHVELVGLYERLGDLKSMRAAYERFSEYFPLTPSIWLTWIKCEIRISNSASEKEYVLSLFDKAVEDYLSVDVWLEYIQFCIGNCEMEKTYSVVERALNTAGLDANNGSLLWDALRELELAQLSLHEPSTEAWQQQANKIYVAFKRQLSVPLLEMENTYEEWQKWLELLPEGHGIDSKPVEWGYKQALKQLEIYKPLEELLLTNKENEEVFLTYKDYIKIVTDPATTLCLYERAVTQLSLNMDLWKDYCYYALKLGDVAGKVSKRSLRNCPWSENLWVMRLRILEQQNCSEEEAKECLEQGLTSLLPSPGLELWLAYLEYVRRTDATSEYLHKIFAQASEQVGEHGDPACKILRLQARLYAREGNMKRVHQTWSHILKRPGIKGSANAWLEYVSLERQYGEVQQVRALYQRAISACADWASYVAEDWSMYERECGTLQDTLKCAEKCAQIVQKAEETVAAAASSSSSAQKRRFDSDENRALPSKRLKTEQVPRKRVNVSDIDTERSVFLSNMREDIGEEKLRELFPNATAICIPTNRKGGSRCYAYVELPGTEDLEVALARDREPIDGRPLFISKCHKDQTQRQTTFRYSTQGEGHKLFVRGLPKKYSQKDIEGIFKPHGAIAVRLVSHKSGQSKGLAYVEFGDEEKAQEAIKATDGLDVDGYKISVAVSAPPPRITNMSEFGDDRSSGPIRHARSRLQMPLVPRSVQVKQSNGAAAAGSQEKTKSNDDFRKMLFNKS